jgi:transcriptional regulator with XRE-family HTH domain
MRYYNAYKYILPYLISNNMVTNTDEEIMREVGLRLSACRLQLNLTQQEIAVQTGLNQKTISHAESGKDPRLTTIIKILRALGRLDALDAFLPKLGISPLMLVKMSGRQRRRARKPRHG